MRIVLIVGDQFTEGMLYKENCFIRANIEQGNEIMVLAPNKKYVNGKLSEVDKGIEKLGDKVTIIRNEYQKVFNRKLSDKIRKIKDYDKTVTDYKPDRIVFYSFPMYDILASKKLKKKFPQLKIIIDSSASFDNSARSIISKVLLHRVVYKRWIDKSLPYIDEIDYVTEDAGFFLQEMYDIPKSIMRFDPLKCEVISMEEKEQYRRKFFRENGLCEKNIVFVHSGKMNSQKLTVEILNIFYKIQNERFRLFLAGSFDEDISAEVEKIIKQDNRIIYLGFLNGNDLVQLLAACDLYLQPGSVSQTAQTALGCSTPIAVPKDYEIFYNNNGFILNSVNDLEDVFGQVSENPEILKEMSVNAGATAREMLDYKNLAL